jgi:dephospho-CoA kinase
MKIIGIAGTNGSGKDTVSLMLKERHGYFVASATEMLEAELKRRGLPLEREQKRTVGNEWRRENVAAIVDRAVEQAKAAGYDKVVVGSLRNPGEADKVHELEGIVVWVDADPKVRYQRITSVDRGRVEDNKTYEQFLSEEQAEMEASKDDEAGLNMSAVKAKADVFIENNDVDIEAFKTQAEEILKQYL